MQIETWGKKVHLPFLKKIAPFYLLLDIMMLFILLFKTTCPQSLIQCFIYIYKNGLYWQKE